MSKGPTRQKHSVRSTNSRRYEHKHSYVPSEDLLLNGNSGRSYYNDFGDRKRSHDRCSKPTRHYHRHSSYSSDEVETDSKKRRKVSNSRERKTADRHINILKAPSYRNSGASSKAKSTRDSNHFSNNSRKYASTTLQGKSSVEQRKTSIEKTHPSASSIPSLHRSFESSATNSELYKNTPVKNNAKHKLSPNMHLINSSPQPIVYHPDQFQSTSAVLQDPCSGSPPSPTSSFARNSFGGEGGPHCKFI